MRRDARIGIPAANAIYAGNSDCSSGCCQRDSSRIEDDADVGRTAGGEVLRLLQPEIPAILQKLQGGKQILGLLEELAAAQETEELEKVRIAYLGKKGSVTELLKAENQMLWVRKMNNIRNRAVEIVNNDLIYT